jgi:hypothetical protein
LALGTIPTGSCPGETENGSSWRRASALPHSGILPDQPSLAPYNFYIVGFCQELTSLSKNFSSHADELVEKVFSPSSASIFELQEVQKYL